MKYYNDGWEVASNGIIADKLKEGGYTHFSTGFTEGRDLIQIPDTVINKKKPE